jgi:hypothetical protein
MRSVVPSCHCPASQLDRVLELLRASRVDAARAELAWAARMTRQRQQEPCTWTEEPAWPEPRRVAWRATHMSSTDKDQLSTELKAIEA